MLSWAADGACRLVGVGVELIGVIGVVGERGAYEWRSDAEIFSGGTDVAVEAVEGGDDLVNVQPSTDDERPTPSGHARIEPDKRVTRDANGLTEQVKDYATRPGGCLDDGRTWGTGPHARILGGMPRLLAAVVVFVTSAAVLVLEILAGRLLAPYIGVTLQTYTGVIGTVLAGIALGSWAGANSRIA